MNRRIRCRLIAVVASFRAMIAIADDDSELAGLRKLSLDALMNVEVTTVSRTESTVGETAAAVFVITPEMIRRSGATTIPELFRMVPGMEVARGVENPGWVVSARGFNTVPANKLLVLMDGRSVYSPVTAGVAWDVQDTLMEDIDRIEVIRGPGGSLWGANAVNGIINIVTKSAKDTQGLLVTAGGGTYERDFGGVRYGWKLDDDVYTRVYVKHYDRDELVLPSGAGAGDTWQMTQTGFRTDWQAAGVNRLTLQGDVYDGDRRNPDIVDLFGANLLGRWTHDLVNGGDLQLQAYYDRTYRTIPLVFGGISDTADVDFQHHFDWGSRQHLTWGLGYRAGWNQVDKTAAIVSPPAPHTTSLYSAFVQDEIDLVKERLRLTVGSKVEHNDFTGFEVQPSARVLWKITPRQSVWWAVSRAVRTPTLPEVDSALVRGPITIFGNTNFVSETVLAYELGYRVNPVNWLSLDIASYYNQYKDLASIETITPRTRLRENKLAGETYGVEVGATWKPLDWFELHAAYTYLHMQLRAAADSTDTTSVQAAGDDPQQQIYLRGSLDLTRQVQLDGIVRYVDRLANLSVPGYVAVDLRLAWRPKDRFEVAIVGQNLTTDRHLEFNTGPLSREPPRSVYGKITYWW